MEIKQICLLSEDSRQYGPIWMIKVFAIKEMAWVRSDMCCIWLFVRLCCKNGHFCWNQSKVPIFQHTFKAGLDLIVSLFQGLNLDDFSSFKPLLAPLEAELCPIKISLKIEKYSVHRAVHCCMLMMLMTVFEQISKAGPCVNKYWDETPRRCKHSQTCRLCLAFVRNSIRDHLPQ